MIEPLHIRILVKNLTVFEGRLAGPLELGRQQEREPEPYVRLPAGPSAPARLVLARRKERDHFARRHALLEPLPTGFVRVTNRSNAPLLCDSVAGGSIAPATTAELAPPFSFSFPGRMLTFSEHFSDQGDLQSLDEPMTGPGRLADLPGRMRSLPALAASQLNELAGWLQTTLGVLQLAVGAADFLGKAADALVQIVGLDRGWVLRLENDQWAIAAPQASQPAGGPAWQPNRRLLTQMRDQKKTFWQSPRRESDPEPANLKSLPAVVAAPILDAADNVIGALYGERHRAAVPPLWVSSKLEATLVELLACGVAAGLARQAQEKVALAAQVRFEQFFGLDLARQLAEEPTLLEGRDAKVTLLFCDLRGFSRFSEKLGPAETLRWINDVMGELSECVLLEQGVLVDYIGDELLAMWGAPSDQPDQAARAARAGLAMFAALAAVNQRWQGVLGGPTEAGIGINTGTARVGNTGSRIKFKYGPLGNAVNLASRIQGLTRYLKCRLLVARATRELLGQSFSARRVVKTQVVNIEQPVDLYEIEAAGSEQQRHFFAESEAALDALESGDFALAARKAGTLLLDHRADGPLLLILSRASNALVQDGRDFCQHWEPPGK